MTITMDSQCLFGFGDDDEQEPHRPAAENLGPYRGRDIPFRGTAVDGAITEKRAPTVDEVLASIVDMTSDMVDDYVTGHGLGPDVLSPADTRRLRVVQEVYDGWGMVLDHARWGDGNPVDDSLADFTNPVRNLVYGADYYLGQGIAPAELAAVSSEQRARLARVRNLTSDLLSELIALAERSTDGHA
jgi:hypothetical protein